MFVCNSVRRGFDVSNRHINKMSLKYGSCVKATTRIVSTRRRKEQSHQ